VEGEAQVILEKPGSIELVDGNSSMADMCYLSQVSRVIVVAVREHDGVDRSPVGFDFGGKDTGVDKNRADKVGVCKKSSSRDPRDWHA
jgi:hypothetical protein